MSDETPEELRALARGLRSLAERIEERAHLADRGVNGTPHRALSDARETDPPAAPEDPPHAQPEALGVIQAFLTPGERATWRCDRCTQLTTSGERYRVLLAAIPRPEAVGQLCASCAPAVRREISNRTEA